MKRAFNSYVPFFEKKRCIYDFQQYVYIFNRLSPQALRVWVFNILRHNRKLYGDDGFILKYYWFSIAVNSCIFLSNANVPRSEEHIFLLAELTSINCCCCTSADSFVCIIVILLIPIP